MFRERIVEWSRMLAFISNAWTEVKISRKISVKTPGPDTGTRERAFSIDPRRTEENRDLARTYIRPMDGNR